MAAAHHREAERAVKERCAREQGDGVLPGVDQVEVFLTRRRRAAKMQQAVLTVQRDVGARPNVAGDKGRHADAKIDKSAIGNVLRQARGHLGPGERGHADGPARNTRSTKMPGVMTRSGSIPRLPA